MLISCTTTTWYILFKLKFFQKHFDTRNIILAAIHALDPASVNEAKAISDADQLTQPISMEDEDPNKEVVNDLDIQAQVTLPSTVRKCNLFITFSTCC